MKTNELLLVKYLVEDLYSTGLALGYRDMLSGIMFDLSTGKLYIDDK